MNALPRSTTVSPPEYRHNVIGRRRRQGWSSWTTIFALCGVTVSLGSWVLGFFGLFNDTPTVDLVTGAIERKPFIHEIWERGELESSDNVEVRCEVRARTSSGTNILEIVPEGTVVEKGDFLVRLDDSTLQTDLIQQQIVCSTSESLLIDARTTLESSKLALEEYLNGTFCEDEKQLESTVFVAEEDVRRAQEQCRYSERLSKRGYVTQVKLEADRFAVEKAQKELEVAQTKLTVLRKYTYQKMVNSLESRIDTAKARLKSREYTWDLDQKKLEEIKDQIEKCKIYAPAPGQVVYANKVSRSSSSGILIEEGRPVRERQVIIRLPDPTKMRVIVNVHESRIKHINVGTPAEIVLDAYPDENLKGKVTEVGEYALPSISVYMSHIKEYPIEVEIQKPPKALRAGMSAEVKLFAGYLPDALQIPIQAVVQRLGQHFCAVSHADGSLETRKIEIGEVNEESVVVLSGVEEGELVILSPLEIEDELDLPQPDEATDGSSEQTAVATTSEAKKKPVPTIASIKKQHATPATAKPAKKR